MPWPWPWEGAAHTFLHWEDVPLCPCLALSPFCNSSLAWRCGSLTNLRRAVTFLFVQKLLASEDKNDNFQSPCTPAWKPSVLLVIKFLLFVSFYPVSRIANIPSFSRWLERPVKSYKNAPLAFFFFITKSASKIHGEWLVYYKTMNLKPTNNFVIIHISPELFEILS